MSLPFEGIRVLDLGISTAGPYAARFLADLGADVIKVEPLDGENARNLGLRFGGTGYLYHVNNYNKRSVTLAVQTAEGRAMFLDLVKQSDAVVENFAIGTMDRWGIGYAACRAVNPSIIYCSAKGFGGNGPLRDKKAFDTVTQAISGIMRLTGMPDAAPLKGGPSVCDLMTATAGAYALAAALTNRKKGESALVDVSLFDMGAWSLLPLWPHAGDAEKLPLDAIGNDHPSESPFGTFDCADGSIFIAVERDAQWRALSAKLGLPEGWSREVRKAQSLRIGGALCEWAAPRNAMSAAVELQAIAVPAAPILDLSKVVELDIVKHRNLLRNVSHPAYGTIPLIGSPVPRQDGPGDGVRWPAPELGADNDAVLGAMIGRSGELPAFRARKVVA
jgi:crotonobetainyl-CoA:carnitine CoA-transferase CaiB-like acyl-CoA transferase